MDKITSKDNSLVKNIIKLNKSAKARREQALFITEGTRLCTDALKSNAKIEFVVFSSAFLEKNYDMFKIFSDLKIRSYELSDSLFKYISDTEHPQGIMCAVKILDKAFNSDTIINAGRVLALENLQDPGNMGTILRTAEAFDFPLVVISSDSCDIYSPKVVRGSMGAVFRQNIMFTNDIQEFIKKFNEQGESFAAVLADDAKKLSEIKFLKNSLVVIGNEGNGIKKETYELCTHKLIIPMSGNAESLNASVAACIIMWEMIK